jgi:hypothetical protein
VCPLPPRAPVAFLTILYAVSTFLPITSLLMRTGETMWGLEASSNSFLRDETGSSKSSTRERDGVLARLLDVVGVTTLRSATAPDRPVPEPEPEPVVVLLVPAVTALAALEVGRSGVTTGAAAARPARALEAFFVGVAGAADSTLTKSPR